jgi:hypothetical protein
MRGSWSKRSEFPIAQQFAAGATALTGRGLSSNVRCVVMPVVKATVVSWLAVTSIYIFLFFIEGVPFNFANSAGKLAFCALVGLFVAMYFAVFGAAVWFALSKLESVTRVGLLLAGLVASIPMLALCVVTGEPEWAISTLLAGVVAGGIYAIQLPSISAT